MNKIVITALAVGVGLLALCSTGCSGIPVTGETDIVTDVVDGNTIQLNSGLTVHLLGISPKSSFSEEYLKTNVLDHEVVLTADSGADEEAQSYDDEIYAYVTTTDDYMPLNRKILKMAGEKAFDTSYLTDSLDEYRRIFSDNSRILTDNELSAMLKASSMLICGAGQKGQFIGTAFFINENGLAISNNHVVNHGNKYKVYLSDSQGNINYERGYDITTIVKTQDYRTGSDYTIFYVNIDEDTKRRLSYLTVGKHRPASGDKIATVGNPAPGDRILNMSYAHGTISAVRDDQGLLQINAPITHGFSGGALVNDRGHVVGISSSGYDNTNANLNFAVDIQIVRTVLDNENLPYAGK